MSKLVARFEKKEPSAEDGATAAAPSAAVIGTSVSAGVDLQDALKFAFDTSCTALAAENIDDAETVDVLGTKSPGEGSDLEEAARTADAIVTEGQRAICLAVCEAFDLSVENAIQGGCQAWLREHDPDDDAISCISVSSELERAEDAVVEALLRPGADPDLDSPDDLCHFDVPDHQELFPGFCADIYSDDGCNEDDGDALSVFSVDSCCSALRDLAEDEETGRSVAWMLAEEHGWIADCAASLLQNFWLRRRMAASTARVMTALETVAAVVVQTKEFPHFGEEQAAFCIQKFWLHHRMAASTAKITADVEKIIAAARKECLPQVCEEQAAFCIQNFWLHRRMAASSARIRAEVAKAVVAVRTESKRLSDQEASAPQSDSLHSVASADVAVAEAMSRSALCLASASVVFMEAKVNQPTAPYAPARSRPYISAPAGPKAPAPQRRRPSAASTAPAPPSVPRGFTSLRRESAPAPVAFRMDDDEEGHDAAAAAATSARASSLARGYQSLGAVEFHCLDSDTEDTGSRTRSTARAAVSGNSHSSRRPVADSTTTPTSRPMSARRHLTDALDFATSIEPRCQSRQHKPARPQSASSARRALAEQQHSSRETELLVAQLPSSGIGMRQQFQQSQPARPQSARPAPREVCEKQQPVRNLELLSQRSPRAMDLQLLRAMQSSSRKGKSALSTLATPRDQRPMTARAGAAGTPASF